MTFSKVMAFYVTWGVAAYAAGIHVLSIEPKISNLKGSFQENFQKKNGETVKSFTFATAKTFDVKKCGLVAQAIEPLMTRFEK